MLELDDVQNLIIEECELIKQLLLEKNCKYGNSAINPKRIFSKQNPIEQIKIRIDDKLSRIENVGTKIDGEDTCKDLIGYLILLRVAEKIHNIQ
jgi:hypothetical protein